MPKLIIGLTGQLASGKSAVAAYLIKNYQAESFGFSQPLRDVLKRLYLEETRANLANLSEILRGRFGSDLISRVITEDLKMSSADLVVLDGIRRLPDIALTKNLPGFALVRVEADEQTRYQRLIGRQQNQDDGQKTFEQFLKDHEAEADRQIPLVMAEADYTLNNSDSLKNLHKQIDELIKKLTADLAVSS
jgi:dephospho-CoA kinase